MKVLNPRTAFLSDYEVLKHLTETKARYIALGQSQGTAHAMKSSNLETIIKEVRDYLQTTPAATQSEKAISDFMEGISAFTLEKAELLMMVNSRPSSIAELDCIVEEMDQRFIEDEPAKMLKIIKMNL
ncbi:RNA polymerase II, partial [Tuber borchii]